MTKELYTIMNGRILMPEDLGLRTISFDDTYDFTGQEAIFSNPFGNYSQYALESIIRSIEQRANSTEKNNLTLNDAISAVDEVQSFIDEELIKGFESEFIRTYHKLKGYNLDEITEQIKDLRNFVDSLKQNKDATLAAMLGFTWSADGFFKTHDVLPKFGVFLSGNLGLEIIYIHHEGILAQAARNGNRLSISVKPSIEDYLTHDTILQTPEPFRSAYNRITWRSDRALDKNLIQMYLNSLDGGIYFGQKSTLDGIKNLLKDPGNPNHHFYYDHFPILVIGPNATEQQLQETAKLAVNLCYKQKGEACLSLQDVFVHESHYGMFTQYILEEKKKVDNGNENYTPLPKFGRELLVEVQNLQKRLLERGALVQGTVTPDKNEMQLLLAYDIDPFDDILATENAIPFLAISKYHDDSDLSKALQSHLSTAKLNKHIYSIAIGIESNSPVKSYLNSNSYRLLNVEDNSLDKLKSFRPYQIGLPHCGGISFLADMFGIEHNNNCFLH